MSLLRILLVWLAVLVTPLQGFASATLMLCGPAHQRPAQWQGAERSVHEAAVPAGDHHGVAPASDAAGPAHAAHVAEGARAVAADGADAEARADLAGAKCSLCAACHAGAALPSRAAPLAVGETCAEAGLARPHPRAGFVTGGPERPPRSFLA